jgi:uncharacterized membrane protein YccC
MPWNSEVSSTLAVHPSGFQYALRILIGCGIVWCLLHWFHHHNPLWAIISVITVSEPDLSAALAAFNSRIVNTLVGCAVGVSLLYLLGPSSWSILLGITTSVLICTHLLRVPGSWRVSPITVAIVMTPSVLGGLPSAGLAASIERTEDVLLGCAVALFVTFAANLIRRAISQAGS